MITFRRFRNATVHSRYMDFSRKVVLFATRVGRIDKSAKAATGRNEIKRAKRIAWGGGET